MTDKQEKFLYRYGAAIVAVFSFLGFFNPLWQKLDGSQPFQVAGCFGFFFLSAGLWILWKWNDWQRTKKKAADHEAYVAAESWDPARTLSCAFFVDESNIVVLRDDFTDIEFRFDVKNLSPHEVYLRHLQVLYKIESPGRGVLWSDVADLACSKTLPAKGGAHRLQVSVKKPVFNKAPFLHVMVRITGGSLMFDGSHLKASEKLSLQQIAWGPATDSRKRREWEA
jgi:hypothetical protein